MLFTHTRLPSRSGQTPSQTPTQTPTQTQTPTADRPIDPLDPSLLAVSNPAIPTQTLNRLALQLNQLATGPISSINTKSPTAPATDPHPVSPRKRLSFKRTSINLANLILGHSTHSSHPQHSLRSPTANRPSSQSPICPSPRSPFLQDQHQSSNNLPACPVCNLSIPIYSQPPPDYAHCPSCATVADFAPPFPEPPSDALFTIDAEDVARLASLALSPAEMARFDASPSTFLQSASPAQSHQVTAFHTLSAQLVSGLFGSLAALSTAFLAPDSPSQPGPRSLRLALVRPFFCALLAGPGGLALLEANLARLLARPGPELTAFKKILEKKSPGQVEFKMWAWAAVLFECPILLPTSSIPYPNRVVMTARLLGLISSLPNHLHHHLVMLYSHKVYPLSLFEEKVEMVNVFIGDRMRLFWGLAGGEMADGDMGDGYMKDWAIVGASRVMSLLFSANTISSKLPISSFYNMTTDLITSTQLISDFTVWESRRRGYYTLTGYPFLLSIQSKITLLQHEGRRQMGFEARQAVVDHLLLGSQRLGVGAHEPVLQISVRRNKIVEDSVRAIGRAEKDGTVRKLLKIRFVGEEGVDGGGLKKEWFLLLIRDLVSPEYGMFTIDSTSQQIWFNPASSTSYRTTKIGHNEETQDEEFRLVGTVLGLAIYNRVSLDVNLPLVCFKKLLSPSLLTNTTKNNNNNNNNKKDDERRFNLRTSNLSTSKLLAELKTFKPDFANGLEWMLGFEGTEEEFQDVFCKRKWCAEVEGWDGEVMEVPLDGFVKGAERGVGESGECGEGGEDEEEEEEKIVTLENRQVFVRKLIEFIINDSIQGQFKAFAEGFLSIASSNALSLLTAYELSQILKGSTDPINITLLESSTIYSGGYNPTSKPVLAFWKVLKERLKNDDEVRKVLRFITGSDRVPIGGIELKICRISVEKSDEKSFKKNNNGGGNKSGKKGGRLPESHTCFNQINLPDDILDVDEMENRIRLAVDESEGFGLS